MKRQVSREKLFTLLFFIFIFVFFTRPLGGEGDFFHHVSTGRYVVEHRSLPQIDDFTFTATGRPWVGYAWGAGVLFYILFSTMGARAVTVLVALLAVLTFFLLDKLLQTYRIGWPARLLSMATIVPVVSVRWPNRPELFTYPFIVAFLLIDRLISTQKRHSLAFLYPLLTVAWANTYGASVIFGLLLLVAIAIRTFITHWKFYFALFLSFFLSFLNGYGHRTIFYIFSIPEIAKIQSEWHGIIQNITFGPIDYLLVVQYQILIYLLYLTVFLMLLFLSRSRLKTHPWEFLVLLGVFIPFLSLRHMPLAAILSLPMLALVIHNQKSSRNNIFAAAAILLMVLVSLKVTTFGFGQETDAFPPALIQFIQTNKLTGNAFTNQQGGAFLTYHFYPQIRVFSDTRDDLYLGTNILEDFYNTFSHRQSVLPLLERYKADIIFADLADGPSYQPLFYSPAWSLVYLRGHHALFVREHLAREKQLRILDAMDPFTSTIAKPGKEHEALTQYVYPAGGEIESTNDVVRHYRLLSALGRTDEAKTLLLSLPLPRGPKRSLFTWFKTYELAKIAFANGDCQNFKYYLDETWRNVRGKFLFMPWRLIPSPIYKGNAFFYLMCQKDVATGRKYLEKFVSQPDLPASEKKQAIEDFNRVTEANALSL